MMLASSKSCSQYDASSFCCIALQYLVLAYIVSNTYDKTSYSCTYMYMHTQCMHFLKNYCLFITLRVKDGHPDLLFICACMFVLFGCGVLDLGIELSKHKLRHQAVCQNFQIRKPYGLADITDTTDLVLHVASNSHGKLVAVADSALQDAWISTSAVL